MNDSFCAITVKKAVLLTSCTHYFSSSHLHVATKQDVDAAVVVLVARRKKKISEGCLVGWYFWAKNEVQTDEGTGDSQEL